jgi:hypothetical protein
MRFANAGVEEAVGILVAHSLQLVALAHGGGEHRNARVLAHLIVDRGARDVCIGRRRARFFGDRSTVFLREGGGRVEENGIGSRGGEAVPFFGHDVEQGRTLEVLYHFQVFAEERYVVAVDGAEVAEA